MLIMKTFLRSKSNNTFSPSHMVVSVRFSTSSVCSSRNKMAALNLYDIADTIGEQCAGQNMKTCSEDTTLALTSAWGRWVFQVFIGHALSCVCASKFSLYGADYGQ